MKISIKYNAKNNINFLIYAGLAAVLWIIVRYNWWILLGFAALYYMIKSLNIELNEKIPWVWALIMFAGGAALTVYSIQYVLLDAEDFVKTTDDKWFYNYLIALAFYFLVQAFAKKPGLTCIISHITLLSFGFIDYFVYQFRGNEITFADLRSAGTGLSVAGKYKFSLDDKACYVILAGILFVALVRKLKPEFKTVWQMRVITVLSAIACVVIVAVNSVDTITETWEMKGTYRNGYLLNFALGVRDSFVSEPEGYSLDVINELESQYSSQATSAETSNTNGKKPTIITIMSESYADLSVVGNFTTNATVTPFFDSLTENTIKGHTLSSVYGAKTPNSEWEYLTGNSMAFLPDGAVVYQQYIDDRPSSLVSTLSNDGYTCVAMHPYYETGWSRNEIYPTMGFDEMHFIDDFDQTNILRDYITDQELFDKIIDRYESKSADEDLFIFGVTMQNHGGYAESYDNFNEEIYKIGYSYTDGNQYLSLLHESDKALRNLISYFESVDEPVEIVFFGDHQPGLNSKFIELLNGKGLSGLTEDELENLYTVPFFIWTNYDTTEETVDITSLNFLSTMTLERAGLSLPPYNQFLSDLHEEIPAINSRGYYSKSAGGFVHLNEATGEEAEWINKYQILQYNDMFDGKDRSTLFFPYPKS